MKEINYILQRVLQMIPVLLLVLVLIFALIRFIPGDPADVMLGARATKESRAMLHAKMGIANPLLAWSMARDLSLIHIYTIRNVS